VGDGGAVDFGFEQGSEHEEGLVICRKKGGWRKTGGTWGMSSPEISNN
jgi:hypothetical protein